ncbi:tRNA dihydrouridine synthase DusB [Frisingicoccus caecimuris]|uniref:tRNA-dihydrouridine synthase n=1 Tax=Frisingicoccus caecimuris TaxID=1796636 RepID=A0A4R2LPW5_9FIRM|nr:tRNA dihydrouridine synthase DusB [Frisingicoccus caecimuris]MCR1917700.1 tRNA dihydrouridine synthase DusB [Frisingicoccus caecimuris]TCO85974.1 tRNA-U20-dihydrouridine synthase [Frisingicoccus caecimuris]
MKIGNVTLKNNVVAAPMAGVTDLPFRLLLKEQGAGLVCSEMVSAKAIYYNNKNTEALMLTDERERPFSLQLFGSEPELMADMVKKIEGRPFDMIDINMGCPVPKVVNNGEGSALMKQPLLAGRMIEAMAKATKKPVTVKMRKGFDDTCINAVEMAHIAQESGAAMVTVHGRTREQYYHGKADWDIIRQVKEAVSIPVIGNGDIDSPEAAQAIFRQTGCDGIMIGRGLQGNPWLISQILYGKQKPTLEEVVAMILRHARMQIEFSGEYLGIRQMRKHVAWYTTGYPGSSKLRGMVNRVESMAALEELLGQYAERGRRIGV